MGAELPIVNLIGATNADARDIMVLGESGILAICPRDERPLCARPARLEWPNGAVKLLFSAEEPDRLRGKQHMKLWCDELAAWRRPDAFDQAMLGLRLGDKPQAVITTTPRPSKIIKATGRRQGHHRHPRLDLRQRAISRARFIERITARTRAARSAARSCSPKSSRRRRARCGRARCSSASAIAPEAAPTEYRRDRGRASIRRRARRKSRRMRHHRRRRKRRAGTSMCSPTSRARARRRAHGRRGSAPPIAASRPIASSRKSTTAATW